jgi:excisionase family DNA binding protein
MGEAAKQESAATAATREWFTTAEACEYTRVPRRTLMEHIAKGTLRPDSRARPGFMMHRFRRATLDAWLMGVSNDGRQT